MLGSGHMRLRNILALPVLCSVCALTSGGEQSPQSDDQQLPHAMHSQMKEQPLITVGLKDADIIGSDDRALQAAMDYISGLGGGVVEIRAGEFAMRDSLHLRSFVTVRGIKEKRFYERQNRFPARLRSMAIMAKNRLLWPTRMVLKRAMVSRSGTVSRVDFTLPLDGLRVRTETPSPLTRR